MQNFILALDTSSNHVYNSTYLQAVLYIRRGNGDSTWIIFHRNLSFDPRLELPRQSSSNEGYQHMFSFRNEKDSSKLSVIIIVNTFCNYNSSRETVRHLAFVAVFLPLHFRFKPLPYFLSTVELQWLEHLLDYENKFETGVVRASEC